MVGDRISSLPDAVLLHILSFLPTKESVATSVLAKRWIPLWRSVSSLDFHCYHYSKERYLRFIESVYIFLNLRDSHEPIQTFRLRCGSLGSDATSFNIWINFAVQRRLEYLDLSLSRNSISIPSCTTLVALKLENASVKAPLTSVDFPSLKTLHLVNVHFSNHDHFLDFLSGSPAIEDLKVFGSSFDRYSTIRPLKSLSKLVKACIQNVVVPLEILYNTEFLRLDWVHHNMVAEEETHPCYRELFPFFPNLTHIKLTIFEDAIVYWVDLVADILKHSPQLQFLSVDWDGWCDDETLYYNIYGKQWKYPESVPICVSSSLKTFCLNHYTGSRCEFEFVKYIMENAILLQSMTIQASSTSERKKLEMLQKLFTCTRGSPSCKASFT